MPYSWREIDLPDFGVPQERPAIPERIYLQRCRSAYKRAGADWLVVYGDREHYGNLVYLTNFDPRFEEAILLLGPDDRRLLLVGNEGIGYKSQAGLKLEFVLAQSLSLMGQDRSVAPRLLDVLRDAGIRQGQTIGIAGWKYLEDEESSGDAGGFFAPAILVDSLRARAGGREAVVDATRVFMHPENGLRAVNEIEQIAVFEWAASRATQAVLNVVRGVKPGMTELQAVAGMGFAGEPLSAHVMFASGKEAIVGLRSPGARVLQRGDGATTAIGYWGGLGCRAGLIEREEPEFLERLALPYFQAIATWYHIVGFRTTGGEVFTAVAETLKQAGLQSLLNPGHLTSYDEWTHTPIRPGSQDKIVSGMAFQCDIIPTPLPPGWAVNCEDPLVFADEALRAEMETRYPDMWNRIASRRIFMKETLGIDIAAELLPLSSIPAYFPPLWLSPSKVFAAG
jgi:hypothetical protein